MVIGLSKMNATAPFYLQGLLCAGNESSWYVLPFFSIES
jgi:hypothetical protein